MRGSTGTAAAIVLAAGRGTRVGADRNKVYLPLAGRAVLAWSLAAFSGAPEIGPLVLVVRPEDRGPADRVLAAAAGGHRVEVVVGGVTRQDSELVGLRQLADRIGSGAVDTVLVHDGARPLVGPALVTAVIAAARESGGAVPAVPRDDLALGGASDALAGPAPAGLVAVQTPQGFRAGPLLAAYEEAARHGFAGTDTASCVQRFAPDLPIRAIPGEERNIKITHASDLVVAERVLTGQR